jgi:lipid-binding SYLF domain-containing protein
MVSMLTLTLALSFAPTASAGDWNHESDSRTHELDQAERTVDAFRANLPTYFREAHGYAVFPTVGDAAFVFGGSHGTGKVYERGELIGNAKVTKVSFGPQIGGKVYSEIVFFRTREAFDRFRRGEVDLQANVSATADTATKSFEGTWRNDMAVFTRTKGGLMASVAVGGQHLRFERFAEPQERVAYSR